MQFCFYKTNIQLVIVLLLFLANTNLHAQSGFYEISTPQEEEILDLTISDCGVCWIQTVKEDKAAENRLLEQPIPIYIKALYLDHGTLTENTIWRSLEKANTVQDKKCGARYVTLTYTNYVLCPRVETISLSLVNNRWKLTNLPPAPNCDLKDKCLNENIDFKFKEKEIILPSKKPSIIKKSFMINDSQSIDISLSTQKDLNRSLFSKILIII